MISLYISFFAFFDNSLLNNSCCIAEGKLSRLISFIINIFTNVASILLWRVKHWNLEKVNTFGPWKILAHIQLLSVSDTFHGKSSSRAHFMSDLVFFYCVIINPSFLSLYPMALHSSLFMLYKIIVMESGRIYGSSV